jgi:hypothetical protein
MSNRVGLREDQRMGHGLAGQIADWLAMEISCRSEFIREPSFRQHNSVGREIFANKFAPTGSRAMPEAGSPASKDAR